MPRAALARGENAAGEAPEPALADGEAGGAALYSVQPEETELLLTALPEGAAELLPALDQWELDGQGRSFCAVSAQTLGPCVGRWRRRTSPSSGRSSPGARPAG